MIQSVGISAPEFVFFFYGYADHRDLHVKRHSFPTRRSSDLGGRRLFRYECDGGICNLTGARLNDYVREYLGDEFTAKDFRTWGGTLIAAIAFAEHGPPETETAAKKVIPAVMRRVGKELGNTPAVARSSYVSPAVIDQYLDGRTIEDFRPQHLRVVRARNIDLDPVEQALLSLLRSWKIRQARAAA